MTARIAAAAVLLAAASCTAPDPSALRTKILAADAYNGEKLNGEKLNGEKLNGEKLNGEKLNGQGLVSLVGVAYAGASNAANQPLGTLSLSATLFSNAGGALADSDLIGMKLVASTDVADFFVTLRVDAYAAGTGADSDLRFYDVRIDTVDGWEPLCGRDNNNSPILAVPFNGRWDIGRGVPGGGSFIDDPNAFTFGCADAALTKCLTAGYRPWQDATHRTLHQTCTRLIRADYCGDGTPNTTNGRLIDLYDSQGIQVVANPSWTFEASWTENGAACVEQRRYVPPNETSPPPCLPIAWSGSCADADWSSTLVLKNRFAPGQ